MTSASALVPKVVFMTRLMQFDVASKHLRSKVYYVQLGRQYAPCGLLCPGLLYRLSRQSSNQTCLGIEDDIELTVDQSIACQADY